MRPNTRARAKPEPLSQMDFCRVWTQHGTESHALHSGGVFLGIFWEKNSGDWVLGNDSFLALSFGCAHHWESVLNNIPVCPEPNGFLPCVGGIWHRESHALCSLQLCFWGFLCKRDLIEIGFQVMNRFGSERFSRHGLPPSSATPAPAMFREFYTRKEISRMQRLIFLANRH